VGGFAILQVILFVAVADAMVMMTTLNIKRIQSSFVDNDDYDVTTTK